MWGCRDAMLTIELGKVHCWISSMVCSDDGKWLFSSDRSGGVKMWKIEDYSLERDFGEAHAGGNIRAIVV